MSTDANNNSDGTAQAIAQVQQLELPSLSDVSTKDLPLKEPIIAELLYAGAHLFTGRPKIGKSWLLLQLTLALAEGETFLGYACGRLEPEVLAVFGEDDDSRLQGRMAALGVARAPANAYIINQQKLIELANRFASTLTFEQFIDTWLAQHPKVVAVVLDTETTCRQIWQGERRQLMRRATETDYAQTRAFDEIALRHRILILLVNHASKRKGGHHNDVLDMHEQINRTNTALAGCTGSVALRDPPDADPLDTTQKRRIFGVRARDLADDVVLAIRQRSDMPLFVSEGRYIEIRQTEAEQEILHALEDLELPPGKYATSKELAEELGKNHNTTRNIITRMRRMKRTTWKHYRIEIKRAAGIRLEPLKEAK